MTVLAKIFEDQKGFKFATLAWQDLLRECQASLMIFLKDLGKVDPFKDLQKNVSSNGKIHADLS